MKRQKSQKIPLNSERKLNLLSEQKEQHKSWVNDSLLAGDAYKLPFELFPFPFLSDAPLAPFNYEPFRPHNDSVSRRNLPLSPSMCSIQSALDLAGSFLSLFEYAENLSKCDIKTWKENLSWEESKIFEIQMTSSFNLQLKCKLMVRGRFPESLQFACERRRWHSSHRRVVKRLN